MDVQASMQTKKFGFFKNLSVWFSAVSFLFGAVMLAAWIWDVEGIKRIYPGGVAVKANTAIGFLLAGASTLLLQNWRQDVSVSFVRRIIALALAFMVFLIGFLTLGEYITNRDFRIDQIFFSENSNLILTSQPGRMAPTTAFEFLVIGLSLVLLSLDTVYGPLLSQCLVLFGLCIPSQVLIGYMLGLPHSTGVLKFTQMALHTSIACIFLSAGILFLRPGDGLTRVLVIENVSGKIARILIPASILIPPILGALILTCHRAGYYDAVSGVGLMTTMVGFVAISTVLVVCNSTEGLEKKIEQEKLELHTKEVILREKENALMQTGSSMERFSHASVDRELRMVELKQEINDLCKQLGKSPRYDVSYLDKE